MHAAIAAAATASGWLLTVTSLLGRVCHRTILLHTHACCGQLSLRLNKRTHSPSGGRMYRRGCRSRQWLALRGRVLFYSSREWEVGPHAECAGLLICPLPSPQRSIASCEVFCIAGGLAEVLRNQQSRLPVVVAGWAEYLIRIPSRVVSRPASTRAYL